jgi:hypothetical protein
MRNLRGEIDVEALLESLEARKASRLAPQTTVSRPQGINGGVALAAVVEFRGRSRLERIATGIRLALRRSGVETFITPGKEKSGPMGRRWRDASEPADFGVVSLHLPRAALCCEESCEAIFDMLSAHDFQAGLCPGCGGASWVPLSTIVRSLRVAPQRVSVPLPVRVGT